MLVRLLPEIEPATPSSLVQDTGLLPMKRLRPPLFLFPPTFGEEGGDSFVVRNRALEISFPFVPRALDHARFSFQRSDFCLL